LADLLKQGPLPLVSALRCAAEVARGIHDLHLEGRAHGRLSAATVVMRESGAELVTSRMAFEPAVGERDLVSFGALLYELILGVKPPTDAPAGMFRLSGGSAGLAGVRVSAVRLAGKCLGALGVTLSMQQAATEVRLLWVVARQLEASGEQEPPPVPAPFLVSPAPAPVRKKVSQPEPVGAEPGTSSESPVVPLAVSDFGKPGPKAPPKLEPAGANCPKCDCSTVYVSRPRSAFERFLVGRNIPICRCHRCYHRYVVFMKLKIGKEMPLGTERRFKPKRRK